MSLSGFQRTESGALVFALLTAVTMIAHQVAGKATRDALFLSHFDVTELPKAVIAAAVLSMVAVLAMSSLLARLGPAKLVPATFGVSAALFLGEWFLFGRTSQFAAVVLYLHMAIFGAILISGFWSVINERFDPHSAKLKIARVAAAAALGGVLGGFIAQRVASLIDVRAMLLVLSVLHLGCVIGVYGIAAPKRPTHHEPAVRSGAQIIARTPYLQQMGLLMVLIAVVAALVDYAFKAQASARFDSSESLITFFAVFYAAVGLATFLVQSLLGPRMLHRFGIGTTIAVLPAMVLVGGMIGAIITHLWSMVLLRGSQTVLSNSFYRSAFELLYTPLTLTAKTSHQDDHRCRRRSVWRHARWRADIAPARDDDQFAERGCSLVCPGRGRLCPLPGDSFTSWLCGSAREKPAQRCGLTGRRRGGRRHHPAHSGGDQYLHRTRASHGED